MKKNLLWLFAALVSCVFLYTACSDDDPDIGPEPVPSDKENIQEASAFSSEIDMATYAGDDFYQYAVGKWIQDNPVPTKDGDVRTGITIDQANAATEALAEITVKGENQIAFTLLNAYDNADLTADSTLLMNKINQVDQVKNKVDMYKLMAQLMKVGYPTPFIIYPTSMQRKVYPALGFVENYELKGRDIVRVGINDKDTIAILKAGMDWQAFIKKIQRGSKVKTAALRHNPYARLKLFTGATTRGGDNSLIDLIASAVNMDMTKIASDEDFQKILNEVMGYDLEQLQLLTKYFILNRDYKYLPLEKLDINKEEDAKKLISYAVNLAQDDGTGLATSMSHSYVLYAIPTEAKAKVTAMFNEFRNAFHKRIDRNDWLTEATKAKAHEKLDAMIILCGWPDNWHTDWEAKLPEGKSAYQKVCNLFEQSIDITRNLVGQTSIDAFFYSGWMASSAYEANALYSPINNYVTILASNMVAPVYDKNQQDFYNYAVLGATTIGHEMTHGFDSNGSKFNAEGKLENWWTPQDSLQFQQKQQLLIDYFDKLEYMPGVYCDGKSTLGENIADLGGLEIAYDAYMAKVTATGDERDFQGREFYRAFATGWRINMTPDVMKSTFEDDEHAPNMLRVNGNVCNTDEWYRLFHIESGNMYLDTDKRIHIW